MASRSLDSTFSIDSTKEFPDAKSPYGHVTHGLRKIVPAELACKLGCKGTKCKYDNSDWPHEKMIIPGLFSNWITDDILAMARPRTNLVREHDLVHNMKKAEIRSIFNLQTRGEHKDCGQGLDEESGFSYNPIDFTSAGIYYYNYELEDYSTANSRNVIDMVKVLCFALQEGKAAVHCHAGLGRTGFFIACYLIYTLRVSANEAIHMIREKRPGSVQMLGQINAIKEFENYMKPLRIIYSQHILLNQNEINGNLDYSFNLRTFLHRQRLVLHGYESKKLKYLPKIVYVCGERLKKLIINWNSDGIDNHKLKNINKFSNKLSDEILDNSYGKRKESREDNPNILIADALISDEPYSRSMIKRLDYLQREINEINDGLDELKNENNPFILAALLWSWIDQLGEPILQDQEINILLNEERSFEPTHSGKYSSRSPRMNLNWNDLDNGTCYMINYLTKLFHELLPIPVEIEERLVNRLINSLTQTIQTNFGVEYETLHNSTKRLEKNKLLILNEVLSELVHKPVAQFDCSLKKFNFKKLNKNDFDYSEEVFDEEPSYFKGSRQFRDSYRRNGSR